MFKDYDLHKVGALSTRIEDIDAISLNQWLSKFVMEVAKKRECVWHRMRNPTQLKD